MSASEAVRSAAYGHEAPLSRRVFTLLFASTLVTAIGNLGLVSVMPAIGRALRIPDFLIACVFSLSAGVWALSAPVWARLADQHGRRPMMMVGAAGFASSTLGCAVVVWAGHAAWAPPLVIFALFALVRSSYGLFGSAAATANQAYVADHSDGAARVRALSGLAGALSLGTILGPAIAPLAIVAPFGLAGPMVLFGISGFVVLAAISLVVPREPARNDIPAAEQRPTPLWRDTVVRRILKLGLLVASAQAINTYTLGFAIIDALRVTPARAQPWIGLTMTAGAASGLVAQVGVVNLWRPNPRAMLCWGALLAALGNVLAVVHGSFEALLIGFPLACFGYGLARPGFAAAASLTVGPERQGAVAGAVASVAGASITLPPIIAVACYQWWWGAPFLIAALATLWVALRSFPGGD